MFFFFNDTATTEIYTLSLHDALPIWPQRSATDRSSPGRSSPAATATTSSSSRAAQLAVTPSASSSASTRCRSMRSRSEEHTSELQSRQYLVCRLLLEKKTSQSHISFL